MKIEILGSGCPNCKKLEENARKAVQELKLKVEIVKVTGFDKIAEYGVMGTPALVVDGEVALSGRIATVQEIKGILGGK